MKCSSGTFRPSGISAKNQGLFKFTHLGGYRMTFLNWEEISSNRVEDYTNQLCNRKSSGNPGGITAVFFLKGTFNCLISQRHSRQANQHSCTQKMMFHKIRASFWNQRKNGTVLWDGDTVALCSLGTSRRAARNDATWFSATKHHVHPAWIRFPGVRSRPRLISIFYSAPCSIVNTECVISSDPYLMAG